ncbi:MAG: tRNA (adenosine(37)-N6)-threonylcarbamoyltransferase complex ATPase subunit type 1 TsaE [Maribacter sp.]|nr:tRNA (adenosine(37)-N6)-threonylcarbamoyltransferase complex ATPase subunit type 1 TsaE [Maribacter sp.]
MQQKIIYDFHEIQSTAKKILAATTSKILCFYGSMGAGKTTLIKALVKELGGADPANSPTFGIVNEYANTQGKLLGYHFDFYRLNEEEEALDLGFEDYLRQDAWIFIEWPEKIPNLLPEKITEINLKILEGQAREIVIA